MAEILMCPPDFYGIEYEINPWMSRQRGADHSVAVRQWNELRTVLAQAGATVHLITPVRGLPDMVFTRERRSHLSQPGHHVTIPPE